MKKTPRLEAIVTAATQEEINSPAFAAALENWKTIFRRIVIVVYNGVRVPDFQHVRFVRQTFPEVNLTQVINAGLDVITYGECLTVADPFCVFGTEIQRVLGVAGERQLGNSWLATGWAVKLENPTDEQGELEQDRLRFFIAPKNVWDFAVRKIGMNIPFISPLWGGVLGTFGVDCMHAHKYHDISAIRAVAVLPHKQVEIPAMEGFGRLTFNGPQRVYLKSA